MRNVDTNKTFFRFLFYFFTLHAIFSGKVSAQPQIWIETFGNTLPGVCDKNTLANGFLSTPNGIWTVTSQGVNDSAANEWFISATEPGLPAGFCSTPGCHVNTSYTDRTLHIGNVVNSPNAITGVICPTGDCGAVYDPGGFQNAVETHKRAESPPFPMSANSNHLLVFNYLELGDSPGDSDKVLIYFNNGITWNYIGSPQATDDTCGSGSYKWERYSIAIPAIPAQANVQIGFLWKNDNGGTGSSPSFAVDSIIIFSLDTAANITVSDTDICVNDTIDFFADTIGVGATYTWTFNGGTPSTSNLQNPSNIFYSSPGTYSVQLIAAKAGYSDTATATIVVNPCATPTANFYASDTVFCERTCITFFDQSTNGATGWTWLFPGGVPSSSTSPSPPPICYDTPGTYDVTLIAYNLFGGDTLVKTAYLQVDSCPFPVANFTLNTIQTCPQHCVSFTDSSTNGPFTSYQWFFPGGTPDTSSSANPVICYTTEGSYDVQLTVTNSYGSSTIVKDTVVNVVFVGYVSISPDTTMLYGSSYHLAAGLGSVYLWTPATGLDNPTQHNPIATPTQTTTYTVSITDSLGCTSYRTVTITILHDDHIFIPNTFSPNGDGINDYLFVRGNNFTKMEFIVFDRWGEKVFESTNPHIGWDGRFKGNELDPGVFTYIVTVNFNDQDLVTRSGSVTLVR